MIRQLSQCPYCKRCEVALDDHPEIVFNPDGPDQAPCEHLIWVDGRYSQWQLSHLGVNRVIGSTEFRWDHPDLGAVDGEHHLTSYLKELVNSGPAWEFAPAAVCDVKQINAEEKAPGPKKGKEHTVWDIDGWALFAQNSAEFLAQLPGCQERQLAGLKMKPSE
jgi:hypothetical protein